uniref:ATP-binding protein n=1 Tax=Nonomuraea sp. CA-251285 TaxID=3240002 RepID=UPI003F4998CC
MNGPARDQRRHIPVSQIDQARVIPLAPIASFGPIPEHVREVATRARRLSPEEVARLDELDRQADAAEFEDARRRREAGRSKLWRRRCPPKYRRASLDGLHPQQDPTGRHVTSETEVGHAVTTWLDGPHSQLFMRGPSRHGKSYAAYAICNAARARGAYVSAWSMPVLVKALRGDLGEKEERAAWAEVADVDILYVDDIGQENITNWTKSELYVIADQLLNTNRRLITTTNYGYSKLVEFYGDPLVERLIEDAVIAIVEGEKLGRFDADPF